MTDVIRIDGAPGAGKTHTLKQKLIEERQAGVGPFDFYWVTFTTAGTEDVEPEVKDVFVGDGDADDVEDRARTLHSLSLSLLLREGHIEMDDDYEGPGPIISPGGSRDDVDVFAEFCDREHIRYDAKAADPKKMLAGEESTQYNGNTLFAINQFLTQTCKPISKWHDAGIDIDMPDETVELLLEEWDRFKREAYDVRLFEHGDYIDYCHDIGSVPDIDVLLMDEFQDFAPQEYRLFKQWRDSGEIDRIYIAGDANQSIYSFKGGTPYYFAETPADDEIVLSDSYRCPSRVAEVGNRLLEANHETTSRGFTGVDTGGRVGWISPSDKHNLAARVKTAALQHEADETSVMLLARTNSQLRDMMNDLQDCGVPFEVLGSYGGVWSGTMKQIYACLTRWQERGDTYATANLRAVVNQLPDTEARRQLGKRHGATKSIDEVRKVFGNYATAGELVRDTELPKWRKRLLRSALDTDTELTPESVKVGTVHSAKGLEAASVFLFTSSTERIRQEVERDDTAAAEEHRVWYVGATRASQELSLVEDYFDAPTATPIRYLRNMGVAE